MADYDSENQKFTDVIFWTSKDFVLFFSYVVRFFVIETVHGCYGQLITNSVKRSGSAFCIDRHMFKQFI